MRILVSGILFLAFTALGGLMGLAFLSGALRAVESPSAAAMLRGLWPPKFEKSFGEALPVSLPGRNVWGRAEYAVFGDGRQGVVAGGEGWLFTAEEFTCPAGAAENLAANLAYVADAARRMKEKNARLAVVLIPAKARVYRRHLDVNLPPCRRGVYAETRAFLQGRGIAVTHILQPMTLAREDVFLKTDTHWSPAGARMAAQEAARAARGAPGLGAAPFFSQPGGVRDRAGDLTRYVPGAAIAPDKIVAHATGLAVASAALPQDLFGGSAPPVTLVGTSYSANPDWNFEGFLKEALQADVLNAAGAARGPLAVMDSYLDSGAWKESPPKLVVWEIPERYLVMPHGVPPE